MALSDQPTDHGSGKQEGTKAIEAQDRSRRIQLVRRRIQRSLPVIVHEPKQTLPVVVQPSNPQPTVQQSALERLRLQLELSLMDQ